MKKALLLLAAAALFFSCQRELDPTEKEVANQGFSFKASIEQLDTDTKATINSENNLVWADNDMIGIYFPNWDDKNQPFKLKEGESGKTSAEFVRANGDFVEAAATVAYFPWEPDGETTYPADWQNNVFDHDDGNGPVMYFKLRNDYWNYTSGKMLTPLVASISTSSADIAFKHTGAAVKLTINNMPTGTYAVQMTVDGQQITGNYKINPTEAGTASLSLDGSADLTKNSLTLNTWVGTQGLFTYIFQVPGLTTPNLSFTIKDEYGVTVWSKSTKKAQPSVGRAEVLVMPALDITPYSKFTTVSEWAIRGKINGTTNWESAVVTMVTDNSTSIAKGVVFAAGDEFKVTDGSSWYPAGTEENNWKVNDAGTYDVIYDHSTHDIKVVATGKYAYPSVPHHSKINPSTATNVGATKTANCYVITAPGSYKIPVVKGNTSESAGVVGGVQLLWETYNNEVTPDVNAIIAAVDYDDDIDDFIFFKTPDTLVYGNALIAAKDAAGNIIWSWHIWIPKDALDDVGEYSISKKYFMDRNLGALVATNASTSTAADVQSFGLLYQWGRKDPFGGARALNSTSRAKAAGIEWSADRTTVTTFDLAASYAHPTTFANYDEWNETAKEWKSVDDPCPAGYKVPDYNSSELLWGNVTSSSLFEASSTYGWWKVGSLVFPFAGYADGGGSMNSNANRTRLLCNTYYKDATTDHPEYPQLARAKYLYASSTSWGYDTSSRKRYASSVRCQKIDGTVPAPPEPDKVGASGIVLDGTFSDWASADAIPTSTIVPEWRFGWNDDYICFYFKVVRSEIKAGKSDAFVEGYGYDFTFRRYFMMALDTDNDSTNGSEVATKGVSLDGCEASALFFPFRGYSTIAEGTDGALVVNGVDNCTDAYIKDLVANKTSNGVVVYGTIDDNYGYLEVGIPRNKIGSPSAGKMKVQFSLSYSDPVESVITIN